MQMAHLLVQAEPHRTDHHLTLSLCLRNAGRATADAGNKEEAHRLFSESLSEIRSSRRLQPERTDLQNHLAAALNDMGYISVAIGSDGAQSFFWEALELTRELLQTEPQNLQAGLTLVASAKAILRLPGRDSARESLFAECAAVVLRMARAHPERIDVAVALAWLNWQLHIRSSSASESAKYAKRVRDGVRGWLGRGGEHDHELLELWQKANDVVPDATEVPRTSRQKKLKLLVACVIVLALLLLVVSIGVAILE